MANGPGVPSTVMLTSHEPCSVDTWADTGKQAATINIVAAQSCRILFFESMCLYLLLLCSTLQPWRNRSATTDPAVKRGKVAGKRFCREAAPIVVADQDSAGPL